MSAPCPEVTRAFDGRTVQCTKGLGHDLCHAVYDGGQLVKAWITHEEFEAARARGDFDRPDICHCADPIPVCEACGGEVL